MRYSEHQSERLYSASLTGDDLDNFLSHRHGARARTRAGRSELTCERLAALRSCDPLCSMRIGDDLTVYLTAVRVVPAGEPISVDYELLEEDMVVQGVDFDCSCGAPCCRGRIVGARRRPSAAKCVE